MISVPYGGTMTVSTTELSLVSGTSTTQAITTDGIYQAAIDFGAMAAGDAFRVRIKEKAVTGGVQRNVVDVTIAGAQASEPVWMSPALALVNGWDITVIKVRGTDRSIDYSIRMVA